MANTIRIKRSTTTAAPSTLANAELAYSEQSSKLFIGVGTGGAGGSATSIIAIGGDGAYLTLDTTQSISGGKTFTGSVNLGSSAIATTQSPGNNSTAVATTAYVDAATAALDLNVTGDSGTVSIDHATETLGILGGTGLTSSGSGNDITINLDNTAVTPGSYGSATAIPTFTVDAQGRLTAAGTASISTTLSTAGDSGTGSVALGSQSLTISGGTGLTATASAQSVSINLDNTAVTPGSYGSGSAVSTFTVDAQGRLTAAGSATISIEHTQVSDFDTGVQQNRLDQLAAPTAAVSLNGQRITGLATPTEDTDAANKGYVDSVAQGIHVHTAVRYATTEALPTYTYSNGTAGVGATITASANGALSVDGGSTSVGDRILVKNETSGNAPYNGVYVVTATGAVGSPFVLTRSTDLDQGAEFPGAFEFVTAGTVNADSGFVCTTDDPVTVGTTAISWSQFSGAGQITAGDGLTKTGNTLDVGTASTSRIVVNADNIDLATTGVSGGDYTKVTVDTYGRITAGSNPTTLSGYGITDAQPLDATLTALAGVTTNTNQIIYSTASDTFAVTSLTEFGRSLIDDADAATARGTLGLGTIATQNANNVAITGGTIDGITFDGGEF